MDKIRDRIIEEFGNKVRIRVCGICLNKDRVLLINHRSLNEGGDFWSPPGGGMEYGMTTEENLKREFLEETGLEIEVEKFMCAHEYLSPPLHAIELFYIVKQVGGALKIGSDPEMNKVDQIIKNVEFKTWEELKTLPNGTVHQIFDHAEDILDLMNLNGIFRFQNKLD